MILRERKGTATTNRRCSFFLFKRKGTAGREEGQIFQGLKIIIQSLAFALKWEAIRGLSKGTTGSDIF